MIEKPRWLDVAWGELGEAEIPGPASNRRIAEYLVSVKQGGDDSIAWCAAFVNWCLVQAGIAGTGLANAKSYCEYGDESPLRVGAIMVRDRGPEKWMGHVAFIVQVGFENVFTIGGNQANRVSIAIVPKNLIIACRFPKELSCTA